MTIICISNDITIRENILSLYGDEGCTFLDVTRQLEQQLSLPCTALIVDLKDNKTPVGKGFNFPIIALTSIPTFQEAAQLLKHGILGYGNRKMRKDNLAQVIKTTMAGQMWLPPAIIAQLITTVGTQQVVQSKQQSSFETLSKRELEVANFVAKGMANQEIADAMYISLRTVKAHLSSIYGKTGLRNRLELGIHHKKNVPV